MNNNPCIIFAVEGNRLLVYTQRVLDNACSPPNEYPWEPRHLSDCVWDSRVGSVTLPGAPKVLSGTLMSSQSYHNHSHSSPVPVMRDPSYSQGRLECPPRVWYSPEIDASKFTLHILSDTPGDSQWLKYILLMKFHWEQLWPKRTILSDCDMQMHHAARRIGWRECGIVCNRTNGKWPCIWSDVVQQFPF